MIPRYYRYLCWDTDLLILIFVFKDNINQGSTFFAHGFKTPQSGFCTVMVDAQRCKSVPYFSSPNILVPALKFKIFGKVKQGNKPPEKVGTNLHNNAEWIKQNRFILQNVGNESMACPYIGFRIHVETVECIILDDPNYPCNTDW